VDGYRDHSAASKLSQRQVYEINPATADAGCQFFNQPDAQIRRRLSAGAAEPAAGAPVVMPSTRRSLDNTQGGLIWDSAPTSATALYCLCRQPQQRAVPGGTDRQPAGCDELGRRASLDRNLSAYALDVASSCSTVR
jgi:hypothetical protein